MKRFEKMAKIALRIDGMDCAEEVATLRAELTPLDAVQNLSFDLLDRCMTVTYADDKLTPDDLVKAVNRTGMRATLDAEQRADVEEGSSWNRWGRTVMTTASGVLLAVGFALHATLTGWRQAVGATEGAGVPWPARIAYLGAVIAGSWFVAPKAWAALRRLRPDMNLLMCLAVAGAIAIGEWFEGATVAFLFAVSLALESWSVGRARRAIAALMALTPPTARVIDEMTGNEITVDVSQVPVGGRFIVKPGEKIPLDGRITNGHSTVNQAPITGESMPVEKKVGDEVFGGSINQDGAIEARAVKPASESTVSQIIKMVKEAQSRRSPSERWVESFARYYTPAIMILALLVAVAMPLFAGDWGKWFYEALVLLVIACPCALVISTPVSVVAALASAARNGVLVKGGEFIELAAKLKAVALDKTGTLTEGRPAVNRLVPLSGHNEEELLEIATAIELRSEHPLAEAIVRHAEARGIRPAPVEGYQAIKGKGATAMLDGRSVWVGSHRYLEERGQETPEMHRQLEELASDGSSVVVIGEDGHVCGFISLADRLRSNTPDAVRAVRAAGVEHVIMLTGDNQPTAQAIARASGIDEFRAELLPQDKVRVVEELVAKYGTVAMVGDGVNDAPALARSSLGIAMGRGGTDAAIETADVAFMSDDLAKLPWLVRHGRRTLSIIRQNIAASIGIKVIFVILTFMGHASLWAAIAADMGVSLLVVFNALRLLSSRDPGAESHG